MIPSCSFPSNSSSSFANERVESSNFLSNRLPVSIDQIIDRSLEKYHQDFSAGKFHELIGMLMQTAEEIGDLSREAKHIFIQTTFKRVASKVFSKKPNSPYLKFLNASISKIIIATEAFYHQTPESIPFISLQNASYIFQNTETYQQLISKISRILANICRESLEDLDAIPLAAMIFILAKEFSVITPKEISEIRMDLAFHTLTETFPTYAFDDLASEKLIVISDFLPSIFELFSQADMHQLNLEPRYQKTADNSCSSCCTIL